MKKKLLALALLNLIGITQAEYMAKVPLEFAQGGGLPNGTIKFSSELLPPEPPVTPVETWEEFAISRGFSTNWSNLDWYGLNIGAMPNSPYPLTAPNVLYFDSNGLTDLRGLSNITSINSLYVTGNNLTSLNGLNNLTTAGALYMQSNQLTNVDELINLTSVSWLALNFNQLTNLNGLINLTNANFIDLENNNIIDISGLSNLTISSVIYIDNTYTGPKLAANTIFCTNNAAARFGNAPKSQLCE